MDLVRIQTSNTGLGIYINNYYFKVAEQDETTGNISEAQCPKKAGDESMKVNSFKREYFFHI
jgi:hypothetical protein